MRLYTRTGDHGETGLLGGVRLPKDDPRFAAIGTLDELNAHLGVALTQLNDASGKTSDLSTTLTTIQAELFTIGAYLAEPEPSEISPIPEARITALENSIDSWDDEAGQLLTFIVPGGTRAAAELHVARAVCRRAERCLIQLHAELPLATPVRVYLNRLSDLLFAAARVVNQRAGVSEITWSGGGAQ